MDPEHVVNVEDGAYFVAVGAALSEETKELEFKDLTANLDKAEAGHGITRDERLALFRSSEEYDAFIARHNKDKVKRGDLATYAGPVYVGIDAGSTTTKIVAIGSEKEILYTDYGSNQGSPLKIVIKELTGPTGKTSSRQPFTQTKGKWKPLPTTGPPTSSAPKLPACWTSAGRT